MLVTAPLQCNSPPQVATHGQQGVQQSGICQSHTVYTSEAMHHPNNAHDLYKCTYTPFCLPGHCQRVMLSVVGQHCR